ncbi:putative glycosyltransferase EpsJ [compost metagenome]
MLISIIVPIYNSASFLEKCVDSILSQTYKNLELILINDGSTDNSIDIINHYRQKDPRIIVLDKPNSGVSDTRNTGIKIAKGETICFVDSDDWIDNDYLEVFIENFNNHNTLLIQNIKRNSKSINKFKYENYSINSQISELFIENDLLRYGAPVAKFYSKLILVNNNVLFNKEVSYGEDLVFFLDYIKHIKSITFLDSAKYNYRYTSGSLSTTKNHPFKNYILVHNKICDFIIWIKQRSSDSLKYFYTVSWDMIETGIDQNFHHPSKIKDEFHNLKQTIEYHHFKSGNLNRRILFLLIKINSSNALILYKKFLFLIKKVD